METHEEHPAEPPTKQINNGMPPPGVSSTLSRLQAARTPIAAVEIGNARPQPQDEPAPQARTFTPEPPTPAYPNWVDRLVQLNREPRIPLTIRINGVGIKLNAIAVDEQGSRVCLLLAGDLHCDLPLSNNVELVLPEKTIKVAFLQQWHKFDCLPFHVVSFCALGENSEVS